MATATKRIDYQGDESRFDHALDLLAAKLDGSRPWSYAVDAAGKVQAYLIQGTATEPYRVTTKSCTCPDHAASGHTCKHMIAAQLYVQKRKDEQGAATTTPAAGGDEQLYRWTRTALCEALFRIVADDGDGWVTIEAVNTIPPTPIVVKWSDGLGMAEAAQTAGERHSYVQRKDLEPVGGTPPATMAEQVERDIAELWPAA